MLKFEVYGQNDKITPEAGEKKGSFVSSKLWFPHKKANPGRNFFGFLKNKKFGTSLNDFQNQELRIPLNHIDINTF